MTSGDDDWIDEAASLASEEPGIFADCPCHCPKFDISPATSDFIRYCMMVCLFCFIIYADFDRVEASAVGQQVREVLVTTPLPYASDPFRVTFGSLRDMRQVWLWLEKVLLPTIYQSGVPLPRLSDRSVSAVLEPQFATIRVGAMSDPEEIDRFRQQFIQHRAASVQLLGSSYLLNGVR
jgi:hypothetical protein